MNLFSWILLALFSSASFASNVKVRRVAVTQDQIVVVKTAVGIATIIQVPDRPNSLVVGDTESFKVEYLEQAITIKPLHAGAKSNLYIYTDYRRFNVQLVAGAELAADYVVYLDVPKEKEKVTKSNLTWTKFRNSLKSERFLFEVNRLGRSRDGVLIVEFKIRGSAIEKFDPGWVWLTQGGSTRPIHRLVLSRLEVSPNSPTEGVMQILRSDIQEGAPLRIELRRKKTSYMTLPEVTSWK